MSDFIFCYRNMNIGGCQLLIMNYAKELVAQGHNAYVLCDYADKSIENNEYSVVVKCIGEKKWNSDRALLHYMFKIPTANIITFIWDDYCRFYSLKQDDQKLIFYAVHYDMVKYAAYSENWLLKIIRKKFLTSTIERLVENNIIVMMDQQTIRHTEEYYKRDFHNACIIHVPVNDSVSSINMDEVKKRLAYEEKNILAIARADFPFKGYLLGLVQALKDDLIPEKYHVTIVTYGSDRGDIIRAIDSLDTGKKNRITLLGKTPYSSLCKMFSNTALYIGMGTTLLDASKYGVVSIPVVAYTNELLCDGFFYENPEMLALDMGSTEALKCLIEKYEAFSIDEKEKIIEQCFNTVQAMYGLNGCTKKMIDTFAKNRYVKDYRIVVSYKLRKIKNGIRRMIGGGR